MSALITHAIFGLLLGLAIRLPLKQLPLAPFLASLPDIDHLDVIAGWPVLVGRATLHNIFVTVVAPVVVFACLVWSRRAPKWHRLSAGAALLLLSHDILDLLPLEQYGSGGRVRLLYPLSSTEYSFHIVTARGFDPTAYSTFSVILLVVVGIAGATLLLGEHLPIPPKRAFVFMCGWLALTPVALIAGAIVPRGGHPEAFLAIEWSKVELPQGRIVASVLHLGGDSARVGSITLSLTSAGNVVATTSNSGLIVSGERWVAVANLTLPPRSPLALTLTNTSDDIKYASVVPTVVRTT